jgi:hypothetical protein
MASGSIADGKHAQQSRHALMLAKTKKSPQALF